MKLSEWASVLVGALAVGLFWGGFYFAIDELLHPSQFEKYCIAIVVIFVWLFWVTKKGKSS